MKKVTDYCDLNIDGLTLRQAIDMLEHAADDFGDDRLIEVDGDFGGGWVRFEFKRPETSEERKARLAREKQEREWEKARKKDEMWKSEAREMLVRDHKIIMEYLNEWERYRYTDVS